MADETPPPSKPRKPRKSQTRIQKQTTSLNAFSKKVTDVFDKLNDITKVLAAQNTRLNRQSAQMEKQLDKFTGRRIAQMRLLNDLVENRNTQVKQEVNNTRNLLDTVKALSLPARKFASNMQDAAKAAAAAQQAGASWNAPASSKWASVLATRHKVGKATDVRDAAKGAMFGAFGAGMKNVVSQTNDKMQKAELDKMVAAYKKEHNTLVFLDREKMKAIELEKKQAAARKAAGYIPWLTTLVDKLRQVKEDKKELDKGGFLDKVSTALHHEPGKVAAATAAGATIGAASSGLDLLKKVFFATWDYIDTKVLPTQALFNRSIGSTSKGFGELKSQAFAVGQQFQSLGYDFSQGTQLVADLGKALFTSKINKGDLKNLLTMSEYVGLGAEQTGRLTNIYKAQGKSVTALAKDFSIAAASADEFQVPVQSVRKEFGELGATSIRWGTDNTREFTRAIAKAQSLGYAYKDVNDVFSTNFDTFESVAKSASDLNQIYGTNLDSIKLLNASDSERLEMFQKAFRETGIVYDKLGGIQQNFIKQATHANDEQAALFFGSETLRKETEKQRVAREKSNKVDKDWSKGLENIRSQLLSMPQLMENLFVAVNSVVMKFFGQDGAIKGTSTVVQIFGKSVEWLTTKIQNFADHMEKGAGLKFLQGIGETLDNLGNSSDGLIKKFDELADSILEAMQPYDSMVGNSLANKFANGSFEDRSDILMNKVPKLTEDQKLFYERTLRKAFKKNPSFLLSNAPGAGLNMNSNGQVDFTHPYVMQGEQQKLREDLKTAVKAIVGVQAAKPVEVKGHVHMSGKKVGQLTNKATVNTAFNVSGM